MRETNRQVRAGAAKEGIERGEGGGGGGGVGLGGGGGG